MSFVRTIALGLLWLLALTPAYGKWTPDLKTLRGRVLLIQSALRHHPNLIQLNLQFRRRLSDTLKPVPEILENLGDEAASIEMDDIVRMTMRYSAGGELIENAEKIGELKALLRRDVPEFPLKTLESLETDLRALFKFCSTGDKVDPKKLLPEIERFFRLMPFLYDSAGHSRYVNLGDDERAQIDREIENATVGMLQNRYEDLILNHIKGQLEIVGRSPGLGRLAEYYNPWEQAFIKKSGGPVQAAVQPLSGDGRDNGLRNLSLEQLNPIIALFRGCFGGDCSIISVPYHVLVKGVVVYAIRKSSGFSGQPNAYALVAPFHVGDKVLPYIITINGALSEADVRAAVKMVQHDWGTDQIVLPNFTNAGAVVNDGIMVRGMTFAGAVTTDGKLPKGWDIADKVTNTLQITGFANYYARKILENKPMIVDTRAEELFPITKRKSPSPYLPVEAIEDMRHIDRSLLASQVTHDPGSHYVSSDPDEREEVKGLLSVTDEDMAAANAVLSATPNQPMTVAVFRAAQKQFPYTMADVANLDVLTAAPSLGNLHRGNPELAEQKVWQAACEKVYRRLEKSIREAADNQDGVRAGLKAQLALPTEFRPSDHQVLSTLLPKLADKDEAVRRTTLHILREFDKYLGDGLAAIADSLKDPVPQLRTLAFGFFQSWNGKDLRVQLAIAEYLGAVDDNERSSVLQTATAWKTGSPVIHAEYVKLLTHEKAAVRLSALNLLAEVPGLAPEYRDEMRNRLTDTDAKVRERAVKALSKLAGHQAEMPPVFVELIGDSNEDVRGAALAAVQSERDGSWTYTSSNPLVTGRLMEFLTHDDKGVRTTAAKALRELKRPYQFQPNLVRSALLLLETGSNDAKAAAARFLGDDVASHARDFQQGYHRETPSPAATLGNEVFEKLLSLALVRHSDLRAQILDALKEFSTDDIRLQRLAAQEVGNKDSETSGAARRFWETTMRRKGAQIAPEAVADLVKSLNRADAKHRGAVDEIIAKLRAHDADLEEQIDELLTERTFDQIEAPIFTESYLKERYDIVTSKTRGKYDRELPDAINYLSIYIQHDEPAVSKAVAHHLGSNDETVRAAAAQALAKWEPGHPEVHAEIEKYLAHGDAKMVATAAVAMGGITGATTRQRKLLVALFASPSKYVRKEAVTAVGKLFGKSITAQTALIEKIADLDPEVSEAAQAAVARSYSDRQEPALTQRLIELVAHDNAVVRKNAVKILRSGSGLFDNEMAIDALLIHLREGEEGTKTSAAFAVAREISYPARYGLEKLAKTQKAEPRDQRGVAVYNELIKFVETHDPERGAALVEAFHEIPTANPAIFRLMARGLAWENFSARGNASEFWRDFARRDPEKRPKLDSDTAGILVGLLASEDRKTRAKVDEVIRQLQSLGGSHRGVLERALTAPRSRRKRVETAVAVPKRESETYANIFAHDYSKIMAGVNELYGKELSPAQERRLIELLGHEDGQVISSVGSPLRERHLSGVKTRQAVLAYLKSDRPEVVLAALQLLDTLAGVPVADTRKAFRLLGHADARVRRQAQRNVGKLLGDEVRTQRRMAELVGDEDKEVREAAIEGLQKHRVSSWEYTSEDPKVLATLMALLENERRGPRESAAKALSKLNEPHERLVEIVEQLHAILDRGIPAHQAAAVHAFGNKLEYNLREHASKKRRGEEIQEKYLRTFETFQRLVALCETADTELAEALLEALYEIPTDEPKVQRLAARLVGVEEYEIRSHAKKFWIQILKKSTTEHGAIEVDAQSVFALLDLTESGNTSARTDADEIVRELRRHPDGWEAFIDEYLRLKSRGGDNLTAGKEQLLKLADAARAKRAGSQSKLAEAVERGELPTESHRDAARARLAETKKRIQAGAHTDADEIWLITMLGEHTHHLNRDARALLKEANSRRPIQWNRFFDRFFAAEGNAAEEFVDFMVDAKPDHPRFREALERVTLGQSFPSHVRHRAAWAMSELKVNDAETPRRVAQSLPTTQGDSIHAVGKIIVEAQPREHYLAERRALADRLAVLLPELEATHVTQITGFLGPLVEEHPEVMTAIVPVLDHADPQRRVAAAALVAAAPKEARWAAARTKSAVIMLDQIGKSETIGTAGMNLFRVMDVAPADAVVKLRGLVKEADAYGKWGPAYTLAQLPFDAANLAVIEAASLADNGTMKQALEWMITHLREKDPNCAKATAEAGTVVTLAD